MTTQTGRPDVGVVAGDQCSYLVDDVECGRPATDIEYGDQGRYEYPRCGPHYRHPCGLFKGPEDP